MSQEVKSYKGHGEGQRNAHISVPREKRHPDWQSGTTSPDAVRAERKPPEQVEQPAGTMVERDTAVVEEPEPPPAIPPARKKRAKAQAKPKTALPPDMPHDSTPGQVIEVPPRSTRTWQPPSGKFPFEVDAQGVARPKIRGTYLCAECQEMRSSREVQISGARVICDKCAASVKANGE